MPSAKDAYDDAIWIFKYIHLQYNLNWKINHLSQQDWRNTLLAAAANAKPHQMNQRRRVVHLRSCTSRSLMRPRFICATSSTMRRPSNIGLPVEERRRHCWIQDSTVWCTKVVLCAFFFVLTFCQERIECKTSWSAQNKIMQCTDSALTIFLCYLLQGC